MVPQNVGNWVYQRKLGEGGFGRVELWKEKSTNKRIAIKRCLLPLSSMTPRKQQRWKQEIENMEKFDHPNIVKSECTPSEMKYDLPLLCMEYCNRGDLRKELSKPENSCGLIQDEVISVMKNISSAVKYLHLQKITHRDIKPENIVIQEKDEMVVHKLIDLGYAKELGTITQTNSLVGTISYVAPELFYNDRYTQSVDYWGLGILFFEVLTGYKPFLLDLKNIPEWVKIMKNKKSNEICAKLIDGNVQLYDYVVFPNDVSHNFLSNLTKWFQIALQWDPKQRGKCPSTDNVVIFDFLKQLFPRKIIHVFSVSLYQLDHYYISSDTTILEMQQWIQNITSINVNEQIIVNATGVLFHEIESSKNLSEQNIPDSTLYVYKNSDLEINQADNEEKLPEILELMLCQPEEIKNYSLLRECFTSIIFLWRNDTILFKHYIFALGIKVDIMKNKLKVLKKNIQENFPKAEVLVNKILQIRLSVKDYEKFPSIKEEIDTSYDKIKHLHQVMNSMKIETESFSDEIQKLFDPDLLLQELQCYLDAYEEFLSSFSEFEKELKLSPDSIIDKVAYLSSIFEKFYEEKTSRLQKLQAHTLIKKLVSFEKKLFIFSEGNFSSTQLLESYENKLSMLIEKINTISTVENVTITSNEKILEHKSSLISCNDAEIKDNIVLRTVLDHTLRKCIQDIKQQLEEIEQE